jgi:hypothetical protein
MQQVTPKQVTPKKERNSTMRRILTTSTALPLVIALLVTARASAEATFEADGTAQPLHMLMRVAEGGAKPTNTLKSPTGRSGATCTSTDGKTECKCGKFDCVGLATTCQCIKSPQPKSPRPTSTNQLSK